jgi:MFS family permease
VSVLSVDRRHQLAGGGMPRGGAGAYTGLGDPGALSSDDEGEANPAAAQQAGERAAALPAPAGNSAEGSRQFLAFLTGTAAISGFLFGYDTGVVSGAALLLVADLGLTDQQLEVVVSATIVGAILGSAGGGPLTDRCGRRRAIMAASWVFVLGAALMAAAPGVEALVAGRFVVGVGVGLASMATPMYIAEAAPTRIRGKLVAINSAFITGGQFVASCVDGALAEVDYPRGWRYMLGLGALPALLQARRLLLPFSVRSRLCALIYMEVCPGGLYERAHIIRLFFSPRRCCSSSASASCRRALGGW